MNRKRLTQPLKESIKLADGKYEIVVVDNCASGFYALRHGEEWRDLCGDNMVLSAFYRIQELEEELLEAESTLNHLEMFFAQYKIGEKISCKIQRMCRLYFKWKRKKGNKTGDEDVQLPKV